MSTQALPALNLDAAKQLANRFKSPTSSMETITRRISDAAKGFLSPRRRATSPPQPILQAPTQNTDLIEEKIKELFDLIPQDPNRNSTALRKRIETLFYSHLEKRFPHSSAASQIKPIENTFSPTAKEIAFLQENLKRFEILVGSPALEKISEAINTMCKIWDEDTGIYPDLIQEAIISFSKKNIWGVVSLFEKLLLNLQGCEQRLSKETLCSPTKPDENQIALAQHKFTALINARQRTAKRFIPRFTEIADAYLEGLEKLRDQQFEKPTRPKTPIQWVKSPRSQM